MSLDTSAVLAAIVSLEAQLAALKMQLGGAKSAPKSGPKSAVKAPKEAKEPKEKKERAPTEWLLFTKRIRSLLESADYGKKDLGGPALLSFCKTLKTENADLDSWDDADILARRADWTVPERKKKASSGASSVVSAEPDLKMPALASEDEAPASDAEESTASGKKKRGPPKGVKLSDEEKAKRKATREANKAKKAAGAAPAPSSPVVGASNAAALPLPSSPKSDTSVLKKIILKEEGRPRGYFVNMETGHAWHRTEDTIGDWAGVFHKTGGGAKKTEAWIDHSARSPLSALEDVE